MAVPNRFPGFFCHASQVCSSAFTSSFFANRRLAFGMSLMLCFACSSNSSNGSVFGTRKARKFSRVPLVELSGINQMPTRGNKVPGGGSNMEPSFSGLPGTERNPALCRWFRKEFQRACISVSASTTTPTASMSTLLKSNRELFDERLNSLTGLNFEGVFSNIVMLTQMSDYMLVIHALYQQNMTIRHFSVLQSGRGLPAQVLLLKIPWG